MIGWGINVLDTPPKTTIFGDKKVKADPMSHGEGNGLKVKDNDHIRKAMCFWKFPEGQGWSPDHPDSRHSLFHFDLSSP